MANDLKCPICGEPTYSVYGHPRKDKLCAKHGKQANAKEIILCENCGKWHNANEECECCKKVQPNVEKDNSSELTCIVCGEPSNGKHFCLSCYHKYKNKTLYIQVKKCKDFVKLEAEYESDLTCEDGHMVKSPYEKIIDDWLYQAGIRHAYEVALDIDETHDIHPDFYIPEYKTANGIVKDIYIEFWGYGEENIQYTKTKEYKKAVYPELCKERGITVLYMTKTDCNSTSTTFLKKLKYLTQGKVNG